MGESGLLPAVERVARLIGAGEVAHQQGEVEPRHDHIVADQRLEVGAGEAEPVDAGIDMDGTRQVAAIFGPECRPFACFFDGNNGRAQILARVEFSMARKKAVEHIDDGLARKKTA